MEDPRPVLAKRPYYNQLYREGATLVGHTRHVLESFEVMFGCRGAPTRLGLKWMAFLSVPEADFDIFQSNGLAACCLHDLGKANVGFQEAVTGKRNVQAIRHEHLSALLLSLPEFHQWLADFPGIRPDVVLSAVLSHHLKAESSTFPARPNPDLKYIKVLRHGVAEVLDLTSRVIDAPEMDCSFITELWDLENGVCLECIEDLRERLIRCKKQTRRDGRYSRLLMAVRSALIAADSCGSALVREEKDLAGWLKSAFDDRQLLTGSYIDDEVIAPRICQIVSSGQTFRPSSFQEASERLGDRALLLAPCGSGKTIAAWRWIKAHLEQSPLKRAIFLYPTRGTATEGFRDYVSWAPEADAALVHGTAGYELEGMFRDVDDGRVDRMYSPEERLFAIGYWSRRIFSATVHQFLGFIQNVYRSTCLMPVIADSIVVVDEVHSFDRNLFCNRSEGIR